MKNLNAFFFSALALLVITSGCSQQRYAHVSKVRTNQEAKTPAPKKEQTAKTEVAVVNENNVTSEVADVEAVIPAEAFAFNQLTPVAPSENVVSKAVRKGITATSPFALKNVVNQAAPVIAKMTKKATSVQNAEDQTLDTSSRWVRMIIIGLILILIGAILGWVFGPLGWLLSTVGFVLVVIGLIFFLLEAI